MVAAMKQPHWELDPATKKMSAVYKRFLLEIVPMGEGFSGSIIEPGFRYRVQPAKTIEETIVLLKKKADEL